jgi:hypothetical protein
MHSRDFGVRIPENITRRDVRNVRWAVCQHVEAEGLPENRKDDFKEPSSTFFAAKQDLRMLCIRNKLKLQAHKEELKYELKGIS